MDGVDLFVLPPFTSLWVARECLEGSAIAWGAQDVHAEEDGAHTGDISARMLADLGCAYVEVGHSERRRDHHESDAMVAAKVAQAVRHGMTPVMCVGEGERVDTTTAHRTVVAQVERGLAQLQPGTKPGLVIAYEPVWAIGSGASSADPAYIEAMHAHIRRSLVEAGRAADVRVIYGGSVDPGSAAAILARDGVDGLFVGRAALDPATFAAIARIALDRRD